MSTSTTTTASRTSGRTRRRRLGGVALAAGLLVAASACNASMDGQTLTALDAQEESFFSNGDEPYLAVIQFRVIPGVPGSTEVHFLGNLAEIAQHIDDGDSATIPDSMARTNFPDVRYANLNQIIAGTSPEIVGAVTVAMESDASPWSAINGIMNDVAAELDHQLRTQIEPMTFLDIVNGDTAATKLAGAAAAIQAAAEPEFWEAVGIFFSSFGDPDDVISFKVLFNVAVAGSDLQDIVDTKLATGLPSSVVGGALRNESLDVDYAGDGATYRVRWNITSS
jgi:hypothetical protein